MVPLGSEISRLERTGPIILQLVDFCHSICIHLIAWQRGYMTLIGYNCNVKLRTQTLGQDWVKQNAETYTSRPFIYAREGKPSDVEPPGSQDVNESSPLKWLPWESRHEGVQAS